MILAAGVCGLDVHHDHITSIS